MNIPVEEKERLDEMIRSNIMSEKYMGEIGDGFVPYREYCSSGSRSRGPLTMSQALAVGFFLGVLASSLIFWAIS